MDRNKGIYMNLTENFKLKEFDCRDGSEMPPHVFKNVVSLSVALQEIRDCVGYPIKITSAYRSLEYNKIIGSKDTSQHVLGKAADLQVKELIPIELYETIEALIEMEYIPEGGLGLYNTFVHYDIRGYKARWDNRK